MSMTEAARQIRKLIEITANNLTDEQAAKLHSLGVQRKALA